LVTHSPIHLGQAHTYPNSIGVKLQASNSIGHLRPNSFRSSIFLPQFNWGKAPSVQFNWSPLTQFIWVERTLPQFNRGKAPSVQFIWSPPDPIYLGRTHTYPNSTGVKLQVSNSFGHPQPNSSGSGTHLTQFERVKAPSVQFIWSPLTQFIWVEHIFTPIQLE